MAELRKRERARDFAGPRRLHFVVDQVRRGSIARSVRDAPRGLAAVGKALAADFTHRDALRYGRSLEWSADPEARPLKDRGSR